MITLVSIAVTKNGEKVRLRFDGAEEIILRGTLFAELGLSKGMELDREQYEQLARRAGAENAKLRAVAMLAARPLSKKLLLKKLVEKGEEQGDAAAAVEYLSELGLIDELEYARMLVRSGAAKGWGAARVRSSLFSHGVERELWDEALSEMPPMDDEILSSLRSRLEPDWSREDERKAVASLYRRGHGWDDIRASLRRLREEYDEQEQYCDE